MIHLPSFVVSCLCGLARSPRNGGGPPCELELARLLDDAFEAVLVFGDDGTIEAMNREARRLFCCPESQRKAGPSIDDLVSLAGSGDRGLAATQGSLPPRVAEGRRVDGTMFAAELSVVPLGETAGGRRAAFVRDVAVREAEQKMLAHQATHDALTDLPNRHLLLERAREMLERAAMTGAGSPSC